MRRKIKNKLINQVVNEVYWFMIHCVLIKEKEIDFSMAMYTQLHMEVGGFGKI